MNYNEVIEWVFIICALYELHNILMELNKRKRTRAVREMHLERTIEGFFEISFNKMKDIDEEQFLMCTRMKRETFDLLLNLLRPKLIKYSIRTPISPECRLFLTLL